MFTALVLMLANSAQSNWYNGHPTEKCELEQNAITYNVLLNSIQTQENTCIVVTLDHRVTKDDDGSTRFPLNTGTLICGVVKKTGSHHLRGSVRNLRTQNPVSINSDTKEIKVEMLSLIHISEPTRPY